MKNLPNLKNNMNLKLIRLKKWEFHCPEEQAGVVGIYKKTKFT
jgi:hypothetical protein